jgi:hypothetical protein
MSPLIVVSDPSEMIAAGSTATSGSPTPVQDMRGVWVRVRDEDGLDQSVRGAIADALPLPEGTEHALALEFEYREV